jgi:hypothetical protein
MKQVGSCLALFTAFVLSGSVLQAAETAAPADKTGKWTFSMSEPGPDLKKISPARQKKIRAELQDVVRIITATPAMKPPKGFETRFWGAIYGKDRYDVCTGRSCPPSRPTAVLAMMVGRYEDKGGKRVAAFNTPATMDISFNNLGHVFTHLPVFYKDADGFLLPEPVRDGERAGMPTFMNNGHAVTVAAGSSRPLWQPVSRERYLKAAIAATAKELAPPKAEAGRGKNLSAEGARTGRPLMVEESRTWIDPVDEKVRVENSRLLADGIREQPEVLQARLQQLQATLAAMPPELRSLPARVDPAAAVDGQSPPLLPADSSSGVAVVTPDFNYFNPKLSPEAIQLLVIQWKFDGNPVYDPDSSGIAGTLNNQKMVSIYKTMDWQRLQAKITRTAP